MHVLLQLGLTEPLGIALAALPALLNVGLLVYSLRNLPSDRVTRTFAFFLAMLVAWQLFDLSVRSATTAEAAASWRGLLRIWQFLAIASGLQLSLFMADLDRVASRPEVLAAIYGPCMLFESTYSAGLVVEHLEHVPVFGWIADSTTLGPLFSVMTTWFSAEAALMAGILVWNVWRTRGQGDPHAAARLFAIGIVVPVLSGLLTEAVLPQVLGIRQIPLTSTTLSVFSVATAYALGRYDLFRVNTLAAAQAVLETLSDSLLVVHATGRVRYANRHAVEVFGSMVGARLPELFDDVTVARTFVDGPWRRALEGDRLTGVDATLRNPRGGPIEALVSMTRLDLGGSGVPSVVVLIHDVGPLKRAEAEAAAARDVAEAASRSKSLFLASTSHELRTPLNAIIGYSQMLAEQAEDDGDALRLEDLGRIESSGRMLLMLIDDLIDLSRVESGRLEVAPVVFHCREMLEREVEPIARELCRKNTNELVVELDDACEIVADRARLRQVLLNLVSNAAKFT
ncbi:MAG: PAS domain-containing protein, partial [Myxococcales bacterium]|nr:PAS domain-containing protein [Myxococcales bacterium]